MNESKDKLSAGGIVVAVVSWFVMAWVLSLNSWCAKAHTCRPDDLLLLGVAYALMVGVALGFGYIATEVFREFAGKK